MVDAACYCNFTAHFCFSYLYILSRLYQCRVCLLLLNPDTPHFSLSQLLFRTKERALLPNPVRTLVMAHTYVVSFISKTPCAGVFSSVADLSSRVTVPSQKSAGAGKIWTLLYPSEDHFAGGYVGVPEAVAQHLMSTFTGSSSTTPDSSRRIHSSRRGSLRQRRQRIVRPY